MVILIDRLYSSQNEFGNSIGFPSSTWESFESGILRTRKVEGIQTSGIRIDKYQFLAGFSLELKDGMMPDIIFKFPEKKMYSN